MSTTGRATASPEALVERISAAALATIDLVSIYLGDRLGYYRSLAADGPATSPSWRGGPARPSGTPASGWSSRR